MDDNKTTMEDLVNELGDECLYSEKDNKDILYKQGQISQYMCKGLLVSVCNDKATDNVYYTIINTKNNVHVHTIVKKDVVKVCECFNLIMCGKSINRNKYSLLVRDKALKLCGFKIRYKK